MWATPISSEWTTLMASATNSAASIRRPPVIDDLDALIGTIWIERRNLRPPMGGVHHCAIGHGNSRRRLERGPVGRPILKAVADRQHPDVGRMLGPHLPDNNAALRNTPRSPAIRAPRSFEDRRCEAPNARFPRGAHPGASGQPERLQRRWTTGDVVSGCGRRRRRPFGAAA